MQSPDDENLAEAITASTRRPLWRLRADWDRDGYQHAASDLSEWVDELELETALESDLPPEATLIEGYTTASLRATLVGRRRGDELNAAETFSPYRSDSPLARMPVEGTPAELEWGFATAAGPRRVPAITGPLRTGDLRSDSNEVEVEVLDPSERLRAPITLPTYSQLWHEVVERNNRYTVNSQWVVDYVLRQNGIYASPPPRADAQLSATGHGGLAAEIGTNGTPVSFGVLPLRESVWIDGPPQWGMLAPAGLTGSPSQQWFTRDPWRVEPGSGLGMAMWLFCGSDTTTGELIRFLPWPGPENLIWLGFSSDAPGSLTAILYLDGAVHDGVSGPVANSTEEWRYVGVHLGLNAFGDTWTYTVRMDGQTTTRTFSNGDLPAETSPALEVRHWLAYPWTNLQVWFASEPPLEWPGEEHESQADIGRGANELTYLPDVSNADSWDLITAVAAAEFARAGYDETGRFYFRPRPDAPATLEPVRELTAARHVKGISFTRSTDSVRNVVSYATAPGYFARYQATENTNRTLPVVDSSTPGEFETPVGVHSFDVQIPPMTFAWTELLPHFTDAHWQDNQQHITHGFVAVRADDPTIEIAPDVNAETTGAITIRAQYLGGRRMRLTVRNNTGFVVRFQRVNTGGTEGQAALRARGYEVQTEPEQLGEARAPGSVEVYGERGITLERNHWRQTPGSLATIAAGLLAALQTPVPTVDDIDIVADPRLQLGDIVRVTDPAGITPSFRAAITRIRTRLSRSDGFAQTVSARPIGPPLLGLLDDAELGIIADTMVLAP